MCSDARVCLTSLVLCSGADVSGTASFMFGADVSDIATFYVRVRMCLLVDSFMFGCGCV